MSSQSHKTAHIDDTTNIIDYYKKYSQNPELPKYFSGNSLIYLPEFKKSLYESLPEVVLKTDLDIIITDEKNEHGNTSRASSVMSNKKLEWDSGADIG